MPDLTMFVPTRGRPTAAAAMQEVFERTCKGRTSLIFIASTDDDYFPDYMAMSRLGVLQRVITVTPDRRGLVDPLNMGFKTWADDPRTFPSFAVGFMGDDHRPRTIGWDVKYVEELTRLAGRCPNRRSPGIGMVYGNDLLQGENLPTQVAMTSNIPVTLGRMVPWELAHLYTDTYWLHLGRMLGRISYLPDVVVEHMHPGAGKAHVDEGYAYSGSFALDLAEKGVFEGIVQNKVLPNDVEKLRNLI